MGRKPLPGQAVVVLTGMEISLEVPTPHAKRRSEQTLWGEQKPPRTAPSGPLEQAAFMPEVIHRLPEQIRQQEKTDKAHGVQSPCLVAAESRVNVKGRIAVLAFLAGMPQPKVAQTGLYIRQQLRVRQQPMCQGGGEVFGGCRGGHGVADIELFNFGNAFERSWCPMVDHALVLQMLVEQMVDASMGGLLTDESTHLGGQPRLHIRRQLFHATAQRVNEELLAHWKTHGQGVHESRYKRILVPTHWHGRFKVNQQLANNELAHGFSWQVVDKGQRPKA